jgi:trigger factor
MPTLSPLKRPSPSRAQCTVTFTPDETKQAQEKALQNLGKNVNLPGFRPGHAPAELVKGKVDPQQVLEESVRGALPPIIEQLIREQNLRPIVPPKVDIEKSDPLTFTITLVERPEVKLKGADKIKVAKTDSKVEQKDIDRMTDYLLQEFRLFKTIERAAKNGDQVTVDFSATDPEGQEIQGTRATGYQLVLGSKTLIPGFEDNLVGMKTGDQKKFDVTFPEKYHAEHLQNKPATFHVHVRGVDEVTMPELTDAFVKEKKLGESKAELLTRIEQSMRAQEEDADRSRREGLLLDAVVKATQVDIAPELLEQEERLMLQDLQQNLEQQNITFQQWMERRGKKPDDIGKEVREEATRRLTLRFGLEALLEEKKIEASADELNQARVQMLQSIPEDQRKSAETYYAEGGEGFEELKWRVRVQKVIGQMLA